MWLFTEIGFFSVVCARHNSGKGPVNPDLLMVRARSVAHLERLKLVFATEIDGEIHHSPAADYPARLFVPKAVWAERIMPELVRMLDYDNFKGRLSRTGQDEYHDACSSVWVTMHRLQERRSYSKPVSRVPSQNGYARSLFDRVPSVREPDPIVIVVEEAGQMNSNIEAVAVLTDIDQFRRSRVAVRDAATRGWIRPIVRARQVLQRMPMSEAQRWYPKVPRISMLGVTPSRGVQGGGTASVIHALKPSPNSKEILMTKEPKRVVGATVAASASPVTVRVNQPAPLVEDTSVVGGVDEKTGAPVIRPRAPGGQADEGTRATDPQESHG